MVSVVAPIFNGYPHYPTCFEPLCRLYYPLELLEMQAINDFSTDDTREFLQGRPAPGHLRLILPEMNLGRAGARNMFLKQTAADKKWGINNKVYPNQRGTSRPAITPLDLFAPCSWD